MTHPESRGELVESYYHNVHVDVKDVQNLEQFFNKIITYGSAHKMMEAFASRKDLFEVDEEGLEYMKQTTKRFFKDTLFHSRS